MLVHEKRRHPRVTTSIPVTCEVAGQQPLSGTVVDLSMGGLFIEADRIPPMGTELTIAGDFPGAPGLRLPSVVRWSKPGGFGVQFGLLGVHVTHLLIGILQRART